MNAVQFKTDYAVGDAVPAGTFVLYEARLYFATKETNSNPDDATVWVEIGEISKPSEPGFFDGLFGSTPNKQDNTREVNPRSAVKPTDGQQLNFNNITGGRRRRRTAKKPRRK